MIDPDRLLRTVLFATRQHGDQRRKATGDPYILHPLRVAQAAMACGLPEDAVLAALLHDVVEDTPTSLEELEVAGIPPGAVRLVALLTQTWADDAPKEVKDRLKPSHYAAIRQDPLASALKLLDRADNLEEMTRTPQVAGWARRYLKRSEAEISPLAERCDRPAAVKAYREAVERLRRALAEWERG